MIPVIPNANYVTGDRRNIVEVVSIADTFVACKGNGCIPSIYNAPGHKFTIDTTKNYEIIRYGLDSDAVIENKIYVISDSVDVSSLNPRYIIAEFTDWDDKKHILFGMGVSDAPIVDKVYVISRDKKVYVAQTPFDISDFQLVGTTDDIFLSIEPTQIYGAPPFIIKPKIPIIPLIIVAATALAGYTIHEYRVHKDNQYAIDKYYQYVNMVYQDVKHGNIDESVAIQYLEALHGTNGVTWQVKDESTIDKIVDWIKGNWKELVLGVGSIIGIMILMMKWRVIMDLFRDMFESMREHVRR